MKQYDEKELKRLLKVKGRPQPPANLLAKLKEEVPDNLRPPALDGKDRSFVQRLRPYFPLAATLTMMLGGGMIAWQLVQEPPDLSVAPVAPQEEIVWDKEDSARLEPTLKDELRIAEKKARDEFEGREKLEVSVLDFEERTADGRRSCRHFRPVLQRAAQGGR